MASENGADATGEAMSQASSCASVDDSTADENSSKRRLRAWRGARVFPNSADQFDRMASRRAQRETLYMAQQKDAIAKDVDEIHDQVYRADQRVRVYLPVGRAIVFESKNTICSTLLPLPLQSLFSSRETLVARMVVFNAMLIAGAILYCFGIHDPTSWMAFGGLLLTPPALYGILYLNTTLLRFCLQQFSCNFMFCNVVVLWFSFFMAFPQSAPVLVGFVGIFACGILYCYQDATTPVFRGRWTAVASGTGLILLLLIVLMHQTHIAQLQNPYFAFDGFEHDLRIRISSFAFNLATYQLRIVVNDWTNASHRLPSARCHMRSIILSPKDMIRLKTIVDALCKLETNTVDSSLTGGSMESVRVAYPVIKPYILLHADCVMSRFLSVRAYRFLYRRFSKPRILFATELCLGAGMTLGVIAATQMRYRMLAIPGSILIAIFWYPLISMMNIRLMRSLLKSFEVLFVLFNLLMIFGWSIFGMHSWLNTLGWTCVLGGCILTLFSDTLPAKLVTSRTRVVIALESFLGLTLATFLIVRGSSDTVNDEFRIPMVPDVHPLQYILGHMINSLIFAFKAVILGFFSRGSPWILRPEMVTSRMPLKFFELFQELMHFEPEDKFENSRSSMDSRTEKSRTHRSVSVLGIDELPTDIPEEEESSVNYS